jgi:hypothetical protein
MLLRELSGPVSRLEPSGAEWSRVAAILSLGKVDDFHLRRMSREVTFCDIRTQI